MKTPALFGMAPVSLSPSGAGTPHPLLVTIKASNGSAGGRNTKRQYLAAVWLGTHITK